MKKTITFVKSLSLIFALGYFSPVLNAQNRSTEFSSQKLPMIIKTSSMGNFHAGFEGQNISSDFLVGHLSQWLGTSSDHTYRLVSSSTDDLGFKHSSYQHFYKGIKVSDDLINIHEKEKKVTFVNGELISDINLVISQALSQAEVKSIVQEEVKSEKTTYSDFEQVIKKVNTKDGITLYSATKVQAAALDILTAFDYYIDNSSKKIIKRLSKIYDHNPDSKIKLNLPAKYAAPSLNYSPFFVDTPSSGETYYRGNQQITVDSYTGGFRLKDNARNIHTLNGTDWDGNGNTTTGLTGNIQEYISTTANFTANDTKPPVEVHWAMKTAHDYYVNTHNRNSYDGNGSIIRNYYNVNFNRDATGAGQSPVDGVNAAAIDAQGIVAMVYGNGMYFGLTGFFYPFVALDVAGHEYSHLMISRTANLAYEGESGALNESFADIFGTSIEFYSGLTPNWNIGEGIPSPILGFTFLRSMSDPNSGPSALGSQQPDTYQGTYWASTVSTDPDHGGVHTNSGVGNFWFYLLSTGGTGTNDSGTSYNVTGITIQKAEKIAYRTLANYLTVNSQYINAYTASKQAATDLYGAGSNELQQVENAWCAVGLGNCATLSVNNITKSESQNINIYPNPVTNGQFTIENSKGNMTYEIYDMSGKLLRPAQKLEKGSTVINISGFQKGIYIIKMNDEGKTISKKVVVS